MAIRDRVRRALHKSSTSETEAIQIRPVAHTNTFDSGYSGSGSTTPSSLHRENTNLTNLTAASSSPKALWSWTSRTDQEKEKRRKQKDEEKEKARQAKANAASKAKNKGRPVHPRDKPLTAQNLKHQEMLRGFTFEFGSSPDRMSQVCTDYEWSPCCTRAASIDGDHTDGSYTTSGASTTLDLTRA